MMMRLVPCFTAAAAMLLPVQAIAQPPSPAPVAPAPTNPTAQPPVSSSGGPSAIELIKLCLEGSGNGAVTNPVCTGYLAGFIGAVRISQTVSEDFPICLPEQGLSNLQVINEVSAYLEQNQEQLQRSARSVFFLVLTQKFPCADPG